VGGVRDAIYVIGGLAVVVFFIVRQRRSDRFRERSLLFPIAHRAGADAALQAEAASRPAD
jgi:hypothetical protein